MTIRVEPVVTVLHHFYRLAVEEAIIDKIGLKDEFSFADVARVLEEYALKAVALDFDHLQRMLLSAIVYLDVHGEWHFFVLRGISASSVWLGAPSWGNIHMSPARFRGMWETRDDEKAPRKNPHCAAPLTGPLVRGHLLLRVGTRQAEKGVSPIR